VEEDLAVDDAPAPPAHLSTSDLVSCLVLARQLAARRSQRRRRWQVREGTSPGSTRPQTRALLASQRASPQLVPDPALLIGNGAMLGLPWMCGMVRTLGGEKRTAREGVSGPFVEGYVYGAYVQEVSLLQRAKPAAARSSASGESHSTFPARRQRARSVTASDST
jgi:hypothetical protein